MKPTNSKLITVAAVIAIFIISSFAYLFYFSKDKTFPSSGSSSESEDKEPDEENTNEDTFNTYPVYPVGTVYGSLQRLGCSANDEILQSYLIGGFVYVIFYSESADYDSRSKNSVGVAKLDGNGVLLGALSLTDEDYKKNAAPVYLASRPVWNGIAVYISFADSASSAIFYVGFEPEIISVRYFDGAGGASYMYFSGDKLYLFGVSENIISVKIFSESFDAPASKTAALPAFCDIFSVYNAANAFYIALNSASGFYIYSFTDKFLNVSFGNVRISQILPSPEGYVI
ncbi:MAG: hypothetical protein LBQ27_02520, partial [Clostridiales bacterium]|nr:hypothetical protein [Clostridiales bacterium]